MMRVPVVAACALCLLAACSSTKELETDSDPPPWPESDTKAAVDNMTEELLQGEWLQRWTKTHEGSPTLLVGLVYTQTIRNVDETLVRRDIKKSIVERSPITGDSIQVIWDKDFLCELRRGSEQTSRCGRSTGPTAEELAREKGADFMLVGSIGIRSNDVERRRQHGEPDHPEAYSLSLGLINVGTTSSTGWQAEKKIERIGYWLESSSRSSEDSDRCRAVAGMSLRC